MSSDGNRGHRNGTGRSTVSDAADRLYLKKEIRKSMQQKDALFSGDMVRDGYNQDPFYESQTLLKRLMLDAGLEFQSMKTGDWDDLLLDVQFFSEMCKPKSTAYIYVMHVYFGVLRTNEGPGPRDVP